MNTNVPHHRIPVRRLFLGMTLLFLALATGCAGCGWTEYEDFPCPKEGTKLTYTNFAKAFLETHCNFCHSPNSTNRRGAPIAYQFDTYEAVVALKKRIFIRSAADNITMPPGPDDPPKEERYKLAEWIVCGTPK